MSLHVVAAQVAQHVQLLETLDAFGDDVEVQVAPLRVLDRVVGAIVIGELLPHRAPLDRCDREILELLGSYAATAIIAAARRRRWRRLPELTE